jgi:3'-5' exoribonuclease
MYAGNKHEISRALVVAGAILHDIGKVREFAHDVASPHHSVEGELLGHMLLGRDMVREAAQGLDLPPMFVTQLEHIIISHQRFPDWGAPKPPMSLEALLVHHADSCDALVGCFRNVFELDEGESELTSKKNVIGHVLLKPPKREE